MKKRPSRACNSFSQRRGEKFGGARSGVVYNPLVKLQNFSSFELTKMLKAWSGGAASAQDRRMPVKLHRSVRRHLADEDDGRLLRPSVPSNIRLQFPNACGPKQEPLANHPGR